MVLDQCVYVVKKSPCGFTGVVHMGNSQVLARTRLKRVLEISWQATLYSWTINSDKFSSYANVFYTVYADPVNPATL